jgi:hypothetical protein
LPLHLAENTESKCFVFRHSKYRGGKSVVFSYASGKRREDIKEKAIRITERLNRKLPQPAPTSTEGRMSSRNTSRVVGVYPAKSPIHRRSGAEYTYYSWKADWVGCPHSGGVSWPCKTHGCQNAYALAVLTRNLRTINRNRILEKLQAIRETQQYRAIVGKKTNSSGMWFIRNPKSYVQRFRCRERQKRAASSRDACAVIRRHNFSVG